MSDPRERGPAGELAEPLPATTRLRTDPERFRDPVADAAKAFRFRSIRLTPWLAFWVAVLVFGVGEKILLPLVQGYFRIGGPLEAWRPDIEALMNGFVLVPTIFAAYVWQIDAVTSVWKQFARSAAFEDEERFAAFRERAERWFRRPWWVVALILAAVGVTFQGFWLWDPANPKPVEPWWSEGEPLSRVVALTLAFPGWYVAAQIVFGQVRLASALRKLWKTLGDVYRLSSKGRTGVVRELSKNVSGMSIIGAVVLLNLVLGGLLPQIRATEASPDFLSWAALIWAAYLVVVPGITLALLWPAHVVMDRRRSEAIERVVKLIDQGYISVDRKINEAEPVSEEIERLEQLRGLREWLEDDLPSWPLPAAWRSVSWSTVVPILLTVVTIMLDRFA